MLTAVVNVSLKHELLLDEGLIFFERFILAVCAPNGRKPINHRLTLEVIFWIARTGAVWRNLPEKFAKWSSVYRQFRRWTLAGLWEDFIHAPNQDAPQILDGAAIRAHRLAAGTKVEFIDKVFAEKAVAARPISAPEA